MRAKQIIDDLLNYAWSKTCTHDETARGGAIWEICESCGAKWADDEGGKPEWDTPQPIRKAEAFLALFNDESEPTHYAVIDEYGEIVHAVKIGYGNAESGCWGFIHRLMKSVPDAKEWTVKGVTVHEG